MYYDDRIFLTTNFFDTSVLHEKGQKDGYVKKIEKEEEPALLNITDYGLIFLTTNFFDTPVLHEKGQKDGYVKKIEKGGAGASEHYALVSSSAFICRWTKKK